MAVYHAYVMSDYTQLDISYNVFYLFLGIMGLLLLIFVGVVCILDPPKKRVSTVKSKPVIGYKKTVLTINAIDPNNDTVDLTFHGVGAHVPYKFVDSAKNGVGFNMYKSVNDSFKHQQQGNVVLEVLGYGEIEEYEKGYITDNQRVLQIFVNNKGMYGENYWYINRKNYVYPMTFKKLISTEWTDNDGNTVIFSPTQPYSYKEKRKAITIPPFKPTVTSLENKA